MHFEILVEDQSGKKALDIIIPKILDKSHTFKVISYKGIGRIPKNLNEKSNSKNRILLDQLPKLVKGYGDAIANYPEGYRFSLIFVCDLDDKNLNSFISELNSATIPINPKLELRFCIAVEEGEAWLLGDIAAIKTAYPRAKDSILNNYVNDSICGTWEVLANALHNGGARALSQQGWQKIGTEKSAWAEKISPHMDVQNNKSPSFLFFRDQLYGLA